MHVLVLGLLYRTANTQLAWVTERRELPSPPLPCWALRFFIFNFSLFSCPPYNVFDYIQQLPLGPFVSAPLKEIARLNSTHISPEIHHLYCRMFYYSQKWLSRIPGIKSLTVHNSSATNADSPQAITMFVLNSRKRITVLSGINFQNVSTVD